MDAIQVDPGRTPRKDQQNEKIIKIAKSPTKYVFKPEVVKSSPIRHGFKKDAISRETINQNHHHHHHHHHHHQKNIPKNLLLRQDATVGFKGFFSTTATPPPTSSPQSPRSAENTLESRKGPRSGSAWSNHQNSNEKRDQPRNRSRERKDNKGAKSPEGSLTKCRCNVSGFFKNSNTNTNSISNPRDEGTVNQPLFNRGEKITGENSPVDKYFNCDDNHCEKLDNLNGSKISPDKSSSRTFNNSPRLLLSSKNCNDDSLFYEGADNYFAKSLKSLSSPISPQKNTFKFTSEENCCTGDIQRNNVLHNQRRSSSCCCTANAHFYDQTTVNGRESPFEDNHDLQLHDTCNSRRYLLDRRQETPVTSLLYRSRSLPQLSVHDSGVGSNEQVPGRPASRLVADIRQLLTLKQHYYPEGGWGWVILVVGILVQILSHGIHGATGIILPQIAARFGPRVDVQSGMTLGNPCEDSGLATSGELGEPSCSGEFDGDVCVVREDRKRDYENHDPRFIAQCTIKQHYYPESGWGWVVVVTGVLVHVIGAGIHGAIGIWLTEGMKKYRQPLVNVGWLGAMSTGVALLVSPVTIAFCRRKSTRVTAVLGGLVTALGCLFTSFASQFHQLFFSYGTVVGIGVGMTRDCSTLMVAQYFKRRREFVEIFIVSGSGLGIAVMSAFIKGAISKIGWRLGLQAVTGVVFLTFILGTFYRSASLYHPQRRAILHLKNQKRKIKDKNKVDDRPPFFDFSTLKSKTVRILLVSTGISAFGINTPIFYLAHQAEEEGLGDTVVLLQAYLGLAWTLGCVAFGLLVVHHSVECRIARQYLTQAAVFMCGLCILALTAVHGNYHGYVMFTWIYGIFCGGYHYSLKMYTYERVRARNFARTWGFVQCSQAIPIAIGVPISGYINVGCGGKAGYYFSSTCVLVGSFTLFFIDLHRRSLSRHKHTRANGTRHLCVSDNCPQRRRLSFSQEPENEGVAAGAAAAALMLGAELAPAPGEIAETLAGDKPELTCISEEGIADMDLPDNLLDDLDYIGDCITSCNKVENYLMLSEFENNLIAEMPIILDRKGRRWSLARSKGPSVGNQGTGGGGGGGGSQSGTEEDEGKPKWRLMTAPPSNRVITVIDEAST